MPRRELIGRIFDARRDRFDAKDYEYRAPLRSLPHVYPPPEWIADYLPLYAQDGMVLDQKKDGSCTGFGLACVVNYLFWESALIEQLGRRRKKRRPPPRVSPRMLYRNAQLYDEYPGEDYSGSSCRGAMKGFSKHGVCSETLWPAFAAKGRAGLALPGWDVDAATRPLGAYYRIDARSLVDMQAAINEIHAIYVSASVHDGWRLNFPPTPPAGAGEKTKRRAKAAAPKSLASLDDAIIARGSEGGPRGGHAFALVGYTETGFIVQNSWGPEWGFRGFAVLPYEDWLENGCDAWALALGVPIVRRTADRSAADVAVRSPTYRSGLTMQQRASAQAVPAAASAAPAGQKPNDEDEPAPPLWSNGEENDHIVLLSQNGVAERTLVTTDTIDETLDHIVGSIGEAGHVVFFIHGGLNTKDEAYRRCRRLGPWFAANGVHPVFLAWRTGVVETIRSMLRGHDDAKVPDAPKGLGGGIVEAASELRDLTFQPLARAVVRPAWEDMKARAGYACDARGGGAAIMSRLAKSKAKIHLVAHSAGALIVGRLLQLEKAQRPDFDSVHLWAPACSVAFAVDAFAKAFVTKAVDPARVFFERLSDHNERDDSCLPGFYGKSLLYLVSRCLERDHKTPILGLERAWMTKAQLDEEVDMDMFSDAFLKNLRDWEALVRKVGWKPDAPIVAERVRTRDYRRQFLDIPADHGSFDNNLDVVNATIARILRKDAPTRRVSDLTGY